MKLVKLTMAFLLFAFLVISCSENEETSLLESQLLEEFASELDEISSVTTHFEAEIGHYHVIIGSKNSNEVILAKKLTKGSSLKRYIIESGHPLCRYTRDFECLPFVDFPSLPRGLFVHGRCILI